MRLTIYIYIYKHAHITYTYQVLQGVSNQYILEGCHGTSKWTFGRLLSSTAEWFSGSMLIFQGVNCETGVFCHDPRPSVLCPEKTGAQSTM